MIVEVMRTYTCRMENAGRCRAQRHMDFRFHRAGRIAGRIHLIYQKTGILVTRISLFRFAILYGLVRKAGFGFLHWADSRYIVCQVSCAIGGSRKLGQGVWPRALFVNLKVWTRMASWARVSEASAAAPDGRGEGAHDAMRRVVFLLSR